LVEKFPTVLEIFPQVLRGDFFTHTVEFRYKDLCLVLPYVQDVMASSRFTRSRYPLGVLRPRCGLAVRWRPGSWGIELRTRHARLLSNLMHSHQTASFGRLHPVID